MSTNIFESEYSNNALSLVETLMVNNYVAFEDRKKFDKVVKIDYEDGIEMFIVTFEDDDTHLFAGDEDFIWIDHNEYETNKEKFDEWLAEPDSNLEIEQEIV